MEAVDPLGYCLPTLLPEAAGRAVQAALEAKGAQVVCLPNASGKVDLTAMLKDLGQKQINEVHVEAGHKLNGSLLRGGLVDGLLTYLAPKLMGQGRGMTNLGPFTTLSAAKALSFHEVTQIGPDLRILARLSR